MKHLIGITGTNGKTSVAYLSTQLLQATGLNSGLMGTLGCGPIGSLNNTGYTTAPLEQNQALLNQMEQDGLEAICMEVSSHGIAQNRILELPFTTAIFTNLSQDHLDYHGTMEVYAQTKISFLSWQSHQCVILNLDDPLFDTIQKQLPPKQTLLTTSLQNSEADFYFQKIKSLPSGYKYQLKTPTQLIEGQLNLIGPFNLYNLLSAVAVTHQTKPDFHLSSADIQNLQAPPGRMECHPLKNGATAIIDYAHTPDALQKALEACRQHCNSKIIAVFGCGGDRDRSKRPLMAQISEAQADYTIITEDNSRFEDLSQILDDIQGGFTQGKHEILPNRGQAIQRAIQLSQKGNIILLAGKGHERFLDQNGEKIPFDERLFLGSH